MNDIATACEVVSNIDVCLTSDCTERQYYIRIYSDLGERARQLIFPCLRSLLDTSKH